MLQGFFLTQGRREMYYVYAVLDRHGNVETVLIFRAEQSQGEDLLLLFEHADGAIASEVARQLKSNLIGLTVRL